MFEEYLIPTDAFSFKKVNDKETWINLYQGNYNISLHKTQYGWSYGLVANYETQPYYSSASSLTKLPVFYTTKQKAFQAAIKHYKKYYPEDIIHKSLTRKNDNTYEIHAPGHKISLKGLQIVGKTGNWKCEDTFGLESFKFQNLYFDGIYDLIKTINIVPQVFQTRKQIIELLKNTVNVHLPSLYDQKAYMNYKEQNDNPLASSYAWWATFIKPEVDLTQIF